MIAHRKDIALHNNPWQPIEIGGFKVKINRQHYEKLCKEIGLTRVPQICLCSYSDRPYRGIFIPFVNYINVYLGSFLDNNPLLKSPDLVQTLAHETRHFWQIETKGIRFFLKQWILSIVVGLFISMVNFLNLIYSFVNFFSGSYLWGFFYFLGYFIGTRYVMPSILHLLYLYSDAEIDATQFSHKAILMPQWYQVVEIELIDKELVIKRILGYLERKSLGSKKDWRSKWLRKLKKLI